MPAIEKQTPEVAVRPSPVASGAKRQRSPRVWNRSMKMIRRVHLYSGLFLVPWVLLYGLTGYLFNHPVALSAGVRAESVGSDAFDAVSFPASPVPAELAAEVFEEWRARREAKETEKSKDERPGEKDKGNSEREGVESQPASTFSIPSDSDASLSARVFLSAGAGRGESGTSLSLDLDAPKRTGRLTVRERGAAAPRPKNPFRGPKLSAGEDYASALVTAGGDLFDRLGHPEQKVRLRSAPTLEFDIEEKTVAGETHLWRASYRLDRRTLSARRHREASGPAWRRFLLRLHTAHTYPVTGGPRWYWAIVVDVMAFAMIVWGVSGLLMWWQIKSLRRVGGLVLIACAVVAAWMAMGMYASMS